MKNREKQKNNRKRRNQSKTYDLITASLPAVVGLGRRCDTASIAIRGLKCG
jgi:hypothetical protein